MKDLTFILPIRIDSMIRLENMLAVLGYLKSTSARIIVIEASTCHGYETRKILPHSNNLKYIHIEDHDPVFFRTHFINVAKFTYNILYSFVKLFLFVVKFFLSLLNGFTYNTLLTVDRIIQF